MIIFTVARGLGLVCACAVIASCGGGGSGGGGGGGSNPTYTVGGTVSGLAGSGLVLQNNGGNNLTVGASGAFTFSAALASGSSYAVTVLTQPSSPSQTCSITSGGSGNVGSANVTSVQVTCVTNTYSVGGTVSGLDSSGLVLQNNGGNDLAISANGSFSFAAPVASGAGYAVTIKSQPNAGPLQNCAVTNGSGTVTNAAVASVTVTCVTRVAKFLYVPNSGSQNVSAYSINASNGTLTEITGSPFPTAPTPRYVTVEPSGKFLYVTSLGSSTEPPRISGYAMNSTTGVLTELPTSPFDLSVPPPPAGALGILPPVLHPSGAFGYLAVPIPNGQVYGGTINSATGELTQIPGTPLTVGVAPAVGVYDSAGKFYFLPTNATPAAQGEIFAYQVNSPSGVLTPIGSSVPTGGVNPWAVLAPGGAFMLVSNVMSGNIAVFSVSATGTLSMVGAPIATGPAGSQSGFPVYHRRLNVVYVANSPLTTASLAAFRFDPATGGLTPLAGSPYSTNGAAGGAFLHPSGKFLFQANAATGSLQRYSIDQATGVPTLLGDVTTPTDAGPYVVVPDPSGRYLYVTNNGGASGGPVTVSVYSVDPASGALTLVGTRSAGTAAQYQQAIPIPVGLQ